MTAATASDCFNYCTNYDYDQLVF